MRKPNLGPLNKITKVLESLLYASYRVRNKDPYKFIDIETIVDDYTIISRDESLLTVFEFNGVKTMMDDQDPSGVNNARRSFFDKIHALNDSTLIEILRKSGHTVEIFFQFDPDGGRKEISTFVSGQSNTTKSLNVNLKDVTDSQLEHLPKFIHSEHCYLGFWTSSNVLESRELKEILERRAKMFEENPAYSFNTENQKGQSMYLGIAELKTYHDSTVEMIESAFSESGFSLKKIPAKRAIAVTRAALNPLETAQNFEIDKETNELYSWEPITFGDEIRLREQNTYFGKEIETTLPVVDYKDAIMPSLASQIIINDPEDFYNMRYSRVGNMIFAPVTITLGPQKIMSFNVLFKRLSEAKIPFFFKQTIKSNGISLIGKKPMLANALLFLSGDNRRISDSYKQILGTTNAGELTVRMSLQFVTSAPADDLVLLQKRHSQLVQHLSAWGQCEVSDISGSPSIALLDSLPFITQKGRAQAMFPNTTDMFVMSPLFRPASIFDNPTILTRSVDGKVMPFELMSSKQTTWGIFTVAKPGSGKSVLVNTLLKGAMLKAGAKEFPFISVIDIGPSSAALAHIIKNALPPNKQHLVQAHKITMNQKYAVNICDLPLMLDEPDAEQLEMMAEIICEIIDQQEDKDFHSLIIEVLKRAYRNKSNGRMGRPRLYEKNTSSMIDRLIKEHNLPIQPSITSWYDIRNMFFNLYIEEYSSNKPKDELIPFDYYAAVAQRYAVPTLYDLAEALEHPSIKDVYKFDANGTNEPITDKFRRLLSSASQSYPNLFTATQIDFSNARFLSIDLDLVATSNKQTTVFYLVYSYLLTKDFRLSKERVSSYPDSCRWYHLNRAETLFAQDKYIVFDEFHRPVRSGSVQIIRAVDRYNREGRKWGMSTILSSQDITDFDPIFIRSFSTSIFLTGDIQTAKEIQKAVDLNDAEYKALVKYCRGPTGKGAPFLAICSTKDEGKSSQLLYSTISPIEAWALSTTKEDVLIREKLTEELGIVEARARLGRAYAFSAKSEVLALSAASERLNNGSQNNLDPIDFIVNKLVNSPPIYSNNLGAVNDAETEVKKWLKEKEREHIEKTQANLRHEINLRKQEQQEQQAQVFEAELEKTQKEKALSEKQLESEIETFDITTLDEKSNETPVQASETK